MNAPRPPLKPLDEALSELLLHAIPTDEVEQVSTFEADGRVLAQAVTSALQVPPQDNSSMDGYAVRSADVVQAGAVLRVTQRIPAGATGTEVEPGTAARIFTGAPVPPGADTIVMQEDVQAFESDGQPMARVQAIPKPGQWIRRSGEDIARGVAVLGRGARLGPAALGLAASVGLAELAVARRPKVALFSTGDELVMPGTVAPADMKPGAIYNSNRFFLRNLLERLGCEVADLGIVPDQREATLAALRDAAQHNDLILTSGGVSVGEEDHIKPAVQALGELHLWQIAMKPGKPFAYGKVGRAHFIGLPGNPVSSYVTFLLLVRPFLLRMQGATDVDMPSIRLPAHFDWAKPDKRREFLRARVNSQGGVELFPNQSSGVLTSVAWADGLVDIPAGQPVARGEPVRFTFLAQLLS